MHQTQSPDRLSQIERVLRLFGVVVCFDCKATLLEEHAASVPGDDYLCDRCRWLWRDHWM